MEQSPSAPAPARSTESVEPPGDERPALTSKQAAILTTIQAALTSHGYPPSVREIGVAVGLASPASVTHQLRALEEKGYLRRDPHRRRALEVLSSAAGAVDARGADVGIRSEDILGDLIGDGAQQILRMPDDAMLEAAILPGDWLVVDPARPGDHGTIVAAEIAGQLTARTLRRRGRTIWLVPQNANHEPIPGADARLLGAVVAVLRRV
ncbi:MAG: transcriptional repressor LexA [Candidatus Nanopelagicales bacterium]